MYKIWLSYLIITVSFFSCEKENKTDILFQTNERMISSMYYDIDINDPKVIFKSIFNSLPNEVVVYPSENYYYFKFYCRGQLFIGSFLFSASNRDSGFVYFGYSQKVDRKIHGSIKPNGNAFRLSKENGVDIMKAKGLSYNMTFEGKTVEFKLNHPILKRPEKAILMSSEVYVGPSFDESGLQFHLIFDNETKHLFWVLNEDVYVSEEFQEFEDILLGRRTAFAFYNDSIHNRRILIAVSGWNLFQNNWYDGPFDQLPDNYVYNNELTIQKYIEASYPNVKGKIDKYGGFLHDSGRAAVIPYRYYYELSDLNFVEEYKSQKMTLSEFYFNITQTD